MDPRRNLRDLTLRDLPHVQVISTRHKTLSTTVAQPCEEASAGRWEEGSSHLS
jgi:hypothetical protein